MKRCVFCLFVFYLIVLQTCTYVQKDIGHGTWFSEQHLVMWWWDNVCLLPRPKFRSKQTTFCKLPSRHRLIWSWCIQPQHVQHASTMFLPFSYSVAFVSVSAHILYVSYNLKADLSFRFLVAWLSGYNITVFHKSAW